MPPIWRSARWCCCWQALRPEPPNGSKPLCGAIAAEGFDARRFGALRNGALSRSASPGRLNRSQDGIPMRRPSRFRKPRRSDGVANNTPRNDCPKNESHPIIPPGKLPSCTPLPWQKEGRVSKCGAIQDDKCNVKCNALRNLYCNTLLLQYEQDKRDYKALDCTTKTFIAITS